MIARCYLRYLDSTGELSYPFYLDLNNLTYYTINLLDAVYSYMLVNRGIFNFFIEKDQAIMVQRRDIYLQVFMEEWRIFPGLEVDCGLFLPSCQYIYNSLIDFKVCDFLNFDKFWFGYHKEKLIKVFYYMNYEGFFKYCWLNNVK